MELFGLNVFLKGDEGASSYLCRREDKILSLKELYKYN